VQYLEEDFRTNRIDDSLQLWTHVVSNPLLKKAHLVLLLNKVRCHSLYFTWLGSHLLSWQYAGLWVYQVHCFGIASTFHLLAICPFPTPFVHSPIMGNAVLSLGSAWKFLFLAFFALLLTKPGVLCKSGTDVISPFGVTVGSAEEEAGAGHQSSEIVSPVSIPSGAHPTIGL
jgi:hypothetical protein